MPQDGARILPLSDEAIGQINSSIHITSLPGVINGLVENALDADATKISISVDFYRGACTVEDNGFGISSTEFHQGAGLAKMYCTSKRPANATSVVTPREFHGSTGTFLARLSELSLLTISSTHAPDDITATLTIHNGRVISRSFVSLQRLSTSSEFVTYGTRVSVVDLFGNLPVRVKQRATSSETSHETEKEWQEIKKNVAALLLAWPNPCTVRLQDANVGSRAVTLFGSKRHIPRGSTNRRSKLANDKPAQFDLQDVLPVLFQSSIAPPESRENWIPLSASTDKVLLKGLVCLDPSPTKNCQFIALGVTPCNVASGYQDLYDFVNAMFSASTFGQADNDLSQALGRSIENFNAPFRYGKSSNSRMNVDHHPRFCLQLSHRNRLADTSHDSVVSNTTLGMFQDLLEAAITAWLEKNGFRPRKRRKRKNTPAHGITHGDELAQHDHIRNEQGISNLTPGSHSMSRLMRRPSSDLALSSRMRSSSRDLAPAGVIPGRHHTPFHPSLEPRLSAVAHNRLDFNGTDLPPRLLHSEASARYTMSPPRTDTILIRDTGPQEPSSEDYGDIDTHSMLALAQGIDESDARIGPAAENQESLQWQDPVSKEVFNVDPRTGVVISKTVDPSHTGQTANTRPLSRLSSTAGTPISLVRRRLADNRPSFRASNSRETEPRVQLPGLIKDWTNPVFANRSNSLTAIPRVDFSEILSLVEHQSNPLRSNQHRLEAGTVDSSSSLLNMSKADLAHFSVLGQVDRKFILCKTQSQHSLSSEEAGILQPSKTKDLLVLVDQHAASERIILEQLLDGICHSDAKSDTHNVSITNMDDLVDEKALRFDVDETEYESFGLFQPHFSQWNIIYDRICSQSNTSGHDRACRYYIHVRALPTLIAQRCAQFPEICISMMRREIWALINEEKRPSKLHNGKILCDPEAQQHQESPAWLQRLSSCPQGMIDMLNSRACRSAIMFNDELSLGECEDLMRQLRDCVFPFICAHGRVSMIPLLDLSGLDTMSQHSEPRGFSDTPGSHTLKNDCVAWMQARNR